MIRTPLSSMSHVQKIVCLNSNHPEFVLISVNTRNFLKPSSSSRCRHLLLQLDFKFGFFNNDVTIDYKKNYYEILQVKQTADLAQIKKSFYKLAKQSHPDTSKGNEDLFKKINEAYNVLSHQQRRKQYDANRPRSNQNPNNSKAQSNHSSGYEQRDSNGQNQYKESQEYQNRTQQAYYHYNRGQWQQFRSGYKYHVTPQHEYYANMTNNMSHQQMYENMKRVHQKKTRKEQQFLDDMEKYFQYVEKVKRKKKQDIQKYHRDIQETERKLEEQRKQIFRKSIFGRAFLKVQDQLSKYSDKIGNFLAKGTK